MNVILDVKINIQRMQVDDLPQVQAIDQVSFSTPWPLSAFRYELLENPNSHSWVAMMDEKIVGFVVFWLIMDEAHLATIAVLPRYRELGVSKKMITIGLFEMISRGASTATLEVRAGNKVAQKLYHHFGFEDVGLRKAYYQDTREDALLMTVEPLGLDYINWLNSGAENPWNSITHQ